MATVEKYRRWAVALVAVALLVGAFLSISAHAGLMHGEQQRIERAAAQLWRSQMYFKNLTGRYFSGTDLTPQDPEHTILRAFSHLARKPVRLQLSADGTYWILLVKLEDEELAIVGSTDVDLFRAPSGSSFQLSPREGGGYGVPSQWEKSTVPPHLLMADGLWILMHCPEDPVVPTAN